MAAKESRLSQLHELVADAFTTELTRRDPESGETLPVSPAMLAAAAKFLKDNGIDCDAEKNDKMKALAAAGRKHLDHPFPVGSTIPN